MSERPAENDALVEALTGHHFCEVEPGSGVGSHLTIKPHEAAYLARLVRVIPPGATS